MAIPFPLRLGFFLDITYRSFELGACTKGHDSAWRDRNCLACSWIPSFARSLGPYREHAKLGDADIFALLERGFEELKYPVEDRGHLLLRDPGFLMDAVSDV